MIAAYPKADDTAIDPEAERIMESVIEIIRSIRNVRAEYKVEPAHWIEAQIYADELLPALITYSQAIQSLAKVKPVAFLTREQKHSAQNALALVLKEAEVIIPMESMVDLEVERKRLQAEIEQSETDIARLETRLQDKAFLSKAPAAVVEKEQEKLAIRKDKLERLKQQVAKFQA